MGINKLHSRDQFKFHYANTSIPYKYRIEYLLQSIARINNALKLYLKYSLYMYLQ